MRKIFKHCCVILPFIVFGLSGCYQDEMINPVAEFEMYYLSEGKEVEVTTEINIANRLYVRNLGEGGYYVFWPGDRIVKTKGLQFMMTDASVAQLKGEGVPESVIQNSLVIKDKLYTTDKRFYGFLGLAIGDEDLAKWGVNFMNASYIALKDKSGKDSVQFTINNNYDDFIHANEKGYYNVQGVPLRIESNNQYSIDYFFRTAGIHKVNYTATGVGDFGKDLETVMVTSSLSVNY